MTAITYGAILQNEVKGWPPLPSIGAGFDLIANNQWWNEVGTPTTSATAVPSSGEGGLDDKFAEVIKCVTDAVDEGFSQRYTYANEPRIRSGSILSAAVWIAEGSGGVDGTVKLLNSDSSETLGTNVLTDGDWDLYIVEAHTCAGTYVDLQITKDTAGGIYAGGAITVMIGGDVVMLPPRRLRTVWPMTSVLLEDRNLASAFARVDLDCTSGTSPLAAELICHLITNDNDSTDEWQYCVYTNGFAAGANQQVAQRSHVRVGDSGDLTSHVTQFTVLCDDQQIIETELTFTSGTIIDTLRLFANGWREWE